MARGVPVLVSRNIDMAPTIERTGAGWVFDPHEASLTAVLREAILKDAERTRRGVCGKRLVDAEYTWPAVTRKLLDLYDEILAHA
jgi:glycosyltransferase involved in cell wall biosynthesis